MDPVGETGSATGGRKEVRKEGKEEAEVEKSKGKKGEVTVG